jgi:predicted DNA-binding transcriptional regulator YafY
LGVRASRLVGLLGLLQARGRMSARQLARELEVSPRTIARDI